MFACSLCGFEAPFKHFGASLPSVCSFLEEGWLAVDPFSIQARPVFLGAPCSACGRAVCTAEACSVFYSKRFCRPCARSNAEAFPAAVRKAAPNVFAASQQQ
ncbi:hypothetical protein VOLCADRAFT_63186 [Volvox carteri f. nagariensis]|uniref:Cysteine-rich DPF motif domain-containing protein 1 n=1 Tax=Volvox carteri f. nagariensis TaxID=3068 RepID=D8U2S3_VOLCA|nr:uncharacterized protein VOLCADRAFT_63186 [Volvox carteri f. nagariensis]EFJ45950.1 hypothetical protein VOLCADRAFT_63186 [Volvox carteri f. nagariensis]|eukprot:XP_002953028.1 hypothetical protein VOLCADRAFT_63186 [Volvox carteri f. nagariensis]